MGDLLTTGGVLAAFLAGGVALFAPCCIVFLAPSYLAAAVKNRRWRLLPLTFLFAAGLAAVLVPITVGISLIAGAIAKYHTILYYAAGALMLVLAVFTLTRRMWSLPSFLRTSDTARGDGASFFALGVFSGIASSCCAPVLVGVMTLSALAGSPIGGVAPGLATMSGGTELQAATGRALSTWFAQIETLLTPVPEPVLGLELLLLAGVFIWGTLIGRRKHHRGTAGDEAVPDLPEAPNSPSENMPSPDLTLR